MLSISLSNSSSFVELACNKLLEYWFTGLPVLQQTGFLAYECDESACDEEVIVPKTERSMGHSVFGFVRGMTSLTGWTTKDVATFLPSSTPSGPKASGATFRIMVCWFAGLLVCWITSLP